MRFLEHAENHRISTLAGACWKLIRYRGLAPGAMTDSKSLFGVRRKCKVFNLRSNGNVEFSRFELPALALGPSGRIVGTIDLEGTTTDSTTYKVEGHEERGEVLIPIRVVLNLRRQGGALGFCEPTAPI
jgi:hypothetical protein